MFKYLVSNSCNTEIKYKIEVDSKNHLRSEIKNTLKLTHDFTIQCYDTDFDEYYQVVDIENIADSSKLQVTEDILPER